MSNILVIGTSHTTDRHAYQEENSVKQYYCKFEEGEKTWPEYLASKLNMNIIDIAIEGIGIETYASRILSIKDTYKVALLEMPDHYRHEMYVEQNINYKSNYLFNYSFWKEQHFKDEIIRYNPSDYDCDKTTMKKINRANKNATQPLTLNDFQASIRNIVRHNEYLQNDKIYATMSMINGYLKSQKVLPVWFSYNFEIGDYEFKDFMSINKQIGKSIKDYVQEDLNYNLNDTNYAGDGIHLNSNYWRQLVDNLFVNFIKEKINA